MNLTCDVLVIGGGPAGLMAALSLSENGISTIILETNKKNNANLRFDITEGHRIDQILKKHKIKPNKISQKSEWISSNNRYILDSKIKDYYFRRGGIKKSFENTLLTKLNERDVQIIFNSEIDTIKTNESNIESVFLKDTKISSKYFVFAEGKSSKFEETLGINSQIFAKFFGLGAIINSNIKNLIPHTKIYFDQKLAPGGYIYSGSVEYETFYCVVIDVFFLDKVNLKKNLDSFIQKRIGRVSVQNYFEGFGISGIKETIKGNALLVGGNAFFHDPFLGYGLNYALESGYYAAVSLLSDNLEVYSNYTKELHNEIRNMVFAREIMKKSNNNFFDMFICALNEEKIDEDPHLVKFLNLFKD